MMTLAEFALLMLGSLVSSYVGVRVAIAEVRGIAVAAKESGDKANQRVDALLLADRDPTTRR